MRVGAKRPKWPRSRPPIGSARPFGFRVRADDPDDITLETEFGLMLERRVKYIDESHKRKKKAEADARGSLKDERSTNRTRLDIE